MIGTLGLPGGSDGKESLYNAGDLGSNPGVGRTWVQTPGWDDPLEKEMATYSSMLAWKIPWTKEPDRPQFMGSRSQICLSAQTCVYTYRGTNTRLTARSEHGQQRMNIKQNKKISGG